MGKPFCPDHPASAILPRYVVESTPAGLERRFSIRQPARRGPSAQRQFEIRGTADPPPTQAVGQAPEGGEGRLDADPPPAPHRADVLEQPDRADGIGDIGRASAPPAEAPAQEGEG